MGEQVGARLLKKITQMSVLYRTDMFQWAEGKAKPVLKNVLT